MPAWLKIVISLSLISLSAGTQRSEKRCRVQLNISFTSLNLYFAGCLCRSADGEELAPSYTGYPAPSGANHTVGRNKAFMRCYERNVHRLSSVCNRNASAFNDAANRVLEACEGEPLTEEEQDQNEPFKGNRTVCDAQLYTSKQETSDIVDVAWICEHEQSENYMVTLGAAGYLIDDSPIGNENELAVVKTCSGESEAQLQAVCDNEPQHFSLTALHIMQSCCKRARAGMGEQKFQCDKIVPQHVEGLKGSV